MWRSSLSTLVPLLTELVHQWPPPAVGVAIAFIRTHSLLASHPRWGDRPRPPRSAFCKGPKLREALVIRARSLLIQRSVGALSQSRHVQCPILRALIHYPSDHRVLLAYCLLIGQLPRGDCPQANDRRNSYYFL